MSANDIEEKYGFELNTLDRALGYIKYYDPNKGMGFINKEKTFRGARKKDIFFHVSQFKTNANIVEGKMVEFRPVKTAKGIQAWDIVVIDYLSDGNLDIDNFDKD